MKSVVRATLANLNILANGLEMPRKDVEPGGHQTEKQPKLLEKPLRVLILGTHMCESVLKTATAAVSAVMPEGTWIIMLHKLCPVFAFVWDDVQGFSFVKKFSRFG